MQAVTNYSSTLPSYSTINQCLSVAVSYLQLGAAAAAAARYEGRIVQSLIRSDGGRGDYDEITPPVLGIWNTLVEGTADATWVS